MALGLGEERLEGAFLEHLVAHGRAAEHQAVVLLEPVDAAERLDFKYLHRGASILRALLDGSGHLQRIARTSPVNDCDLAHKILHFLLYK